MHTKSNTLSVVNHLKNKQEDFEWYPTTQEIIETVKASIEAQYTSHISLDRYSLLDCGAGDGRVLNQLANGSKYAIEKSKSLLGLLDRNISIIGTDFHETTLIDKKVDVIFCNPPYSEYEQWTSKIIREANASDIYLVIPERWNDNNNIKQALEARKAKSQIIGNFNFLKADRNARAIVNIVHIQLKEKSYRGLTVDPFDIWFETNFPKRQQTENKKKDTLKEELENQVANGRNLIEVLVELYNQEMGMLNDNFKAIAKLDDQILSELNVNVEAIKDALRQRIKGLKNKYWKEFFSNYTVINKKLTAGSREKMLNKLYEHTQVEFTEANAYAITGWCIKNANIYFNSQLIHAVEKLVNNCNITAYKSNERTFKTENWRYGRYEEMKSINRYALDLRCIVTGQGGVNGGSYRSYEYPNGLHQTASSTINDLIVIANNLGFSCCQNTNQMMEWSKNRNQNIIADDGQVLMNVKAFLNGNLHIKFNQKLIKKINVEFGRVNGQ